MESKNNSSVPVDFDVHPEWDRVDESIQVDTIEELFQETEEEKQQRLIQESEFVSVDISVEDDYVGNYKQVEIKKKKVPTKKIGICSFVVGVFSIIFNINLCIAGIILGLTAIILAMIAIGKHRGRGFGVAGICFGIVGMAVSIIFTTNIYNMYKDAKRTYDTYNGTSEYSLGDFFDDFLDVYDFHF